MAGFKKGLTSMELDDEDKIDRGIPMVAEPGRRNTPDFPWGLRISFDHKDLAKLKLDCKDCDVGDEFHFVAMARVKSKSSESSEGGEHSRVELQIEKIKLIDDAEA